MVQKVIDCRDGRNKDFLFVEGEFLLEELMMSEHLTTDVFCSSPKESLVRRVISGSKRPSCRVHVVSDIVMNKMSDMSSPPGVIALVRHPASAPSLPDLTLDSFVLVLHRVQLPQNAGALMRTAEATSVKHVWCTSETADPFSAKSIRGSMGSLFRLDVKSQLTLTDTLFSLKEEGFVITAATSEGKIRYDQMNWKQRVALVVGNEAHGLSVEDLALVDSTITIPMNGRVDSLNVGVAGAVCLYEAFRQRGFKALP